ncbi:MAG: hypothetical protein C5B57_04745 [Blastocatellia bacterium]|nr:MAG: hypothetical protein C5B57_04745 [Blastocatellia bacterium]
MRVVTISSSRSVDSPDPIPRSTFGGRASWSALTDGSWGLSILPAAIDQGRAAPADRFWTLDPVDGTQGFVRGDQYVVALALMVRGQLAVGGIGCAALHPIALGNARWGPRVPPTDAYQRDWMDRVCLSWPPRVGGFIPRRGVQPSSCLGLSTRA